MTPGQITAARKGLGMDPGPFARLLNVDVRTLSRWEAGGTAPASTAQAIIAAFIEIEPTAENVELLSKASAVGGIGYLLIKLIGERPTRSKSAR